MHPSHQKFGAMTLKDSTIYTHVQQVSFQFLSTESTQRFGLGTTMPNRALKHSVIFGPIKSCHTVRPMSASNMNIKELLRETFVQTLVPVRLNKGMKNILKKSQAVYFIFWNDLHHFSFDSSPLTSYPNSYPALSIFIQTFNFKRQTVLFYFEFHV